MLTLRKRKEISALMLAVLFVLLCAGSVLHTTNIYWKPLCTMAVIGILFETRIIVLPFIKTTGVTLLSSVLLGAGLNFGVSFVFMLLAVIFPVTLIYYKPRYWTEVLFNTTNYGISTAGAIGAYLASGGSLSKVDLVHPLPILAYILVYFVMNNILVAFYVTMAGAEQPLKHIITDGLAAPFLAVYAIVMLLGVIVAVFIQYNCYWGITVICCLLWLVEFTYRRYFHALHESLMDSLTGLNNRRFFHMKLEQLLHKRRSFSILMLDVDHFKEYNDRLGHPAGDALLFDLGKVLASELKPNQYVCRYGGEEFSLMLPDTSSESARIIADNIRTVVEGHIFSLGDSQEHVTVSIGVSTYPQIADTKERLLASVDGALYQAKEEGRNRVRVAT